MVKTLILFLLIVSVYLYKTSLLLLEGYQYELRRSIKAKNYKSFHKNRYYIYSFRVGIFVKIGRTRNIQKRLHEHSISHPLPLHIISVVPVRDDRFAELYLHQKYKRYRLKNKEWFIASPNLLLDLILLNHNVSNFEVKSSL